MASIDDIRLSAARFSEQFEGFEGSLRKAAAKWFAAHGCDTKPEMPYCLKSHQLWRQNIICGDVAEYIESSPWPNESRPKFPLHRYVHHGLSSQAMVFNLVGPLIVRDDFEPLLKVIGETVGVRPGGKIRAGFEYEDRSVFNERSGQPTSIDLVVNVENTSIFVEAKLAEHGFGGCSIYGRGECQGKNPNITQLSDCYLHRAEIRYWTAMEKYDFVNTRIAKGPICPFVQFYQFFREILFSLHNSGKFLLLCDSRNPAFVGETGIWPYLFISIPRRYRDDIGVITIQQLVRTIEATGRHTDWIYDFKSKYAIS